MVSKKDKQFMVDLKKFSDEQLAAEVTSMRAKLHTLKTQATTEKVEDISQFKKVRRNIARAATEVTRRRQAAAK
jgi:ribosomal protein L29